MLKRLKICLFGGMKVETRIDGVHVVTHIKGLLNEIFSYLMR